MFKLNDLLTIKPEYLEANESTNDVYLVVGDESDYGAVKITPAWNTGLPFAPIQTMRAECFNLYKRG